MRRDAFSRCHPAVNFMFFLGALGFSMVIQHPAYIAAGFLGAAVYYTVLKGRAALKTVLGLLPVFIIITAINPIFNTYGQHRLFMLFGRAYTLEALCYGAALGGIFVTMMLWFGCYSAVMTSDKFTSLFGNLIPSLSLLLVMVLRLIPSFIKKAGQINGARRSIGKGTGEKSSFREKAGDAMYVLSALTDWSLEGSITTADSMRSRGYGMARRTTFQIYRFTFRDGVLLCAELLLGGAVILAGSTAASFTPRMHFDPVSWGFPAYCVFLLIPIFVEITEAVQWHISVSKI